MGCSMGKLTDVVEASPTQSIALQHIEVLRCLGVGAFGEVNAVRFKFHPSQYRAKTSNASGTVQASSFDGDDDHLYALKRINKKKLAAKATSLAGTLVERELLEEFWDHEGVSSIVRMHASFQDTDTLYLVLDLMLGGSLDFHLAKGNFDACDDSFVRFVGLELANALDSLHSVGILHRDIKPDNIMMDSKGHVFLADFNLSYKYDPAVNNKKEKKEITKKDFLIRDHMIVGTRDYLAPEMLAGKPYGRAIDYWSLGVLLYQLYYKRTPWNMEQGMDKFAYEEAIRGMLEVPTVEAEEVIVNFRENNTEDSGGMQSDSTGSRIETEFISSVKMKPIVYPRGNSEVVKMLNGFLCRSVSKRLNYEGLKSMKLFEDVKNWEKPELKPSFIPQENAVNADTRFEVMQALGGSYPSGQKKMRKSLKVDFMKEQLDRYWCWHFNKFRGGEEPDPFLQIMESRLANAPGDPSNNGKGKVIDHAKRQNTKSTRLRTLANRLQSSLQEAHSQNSMHAAGSMTPAPAVTKGLIAPGSGQTAVQSL